MGNQSWKRSSGTMWVNVGDFVTKSSLNVLTFGEVSVHDTIQTLIAITDTTGHKSSCKRCRTIQINVTANVPHTPDVVKAWATDCWYMWGEGKILIKYYSEILSRFNRVSFDAEKLNRKHTEVLASLSFVPDKQEFVFIYVHFQLIWRHPWMDRGQTWL